MALESVISLVETLILRLNFTFYFVEIIGSLIRNPLGHIKIRDSQAVVHINLWLQHYIACCSSIKNPQFIHVLVKRIILSQGLAI